MLAGFALSAGVVTCQIYTDDLVLWDRSIDRPEGMSVTEADAISKAEGECRAKGEAWDRRRQSGRHRASAD